MMKKVFLCITIFLGINCSWIYAQSVGPAVINSTGGSKVINGNTYEYSIGQAFANEAQTIANIVITPGVLQPQFENGVGIKERPITLGEINVFPNPTANRINIKGNFTKPGIMHCVLTDILGRELILEKFHLQNGKEKNNLSLEHLPAGIYNLNILWEEGDKKQQFTYKIEKIH